jgi:hypothetical protein
MYLTKILFFGFLTFNSFTNSFQKRGDCNNLIVSIAMEKEPGGRKVTVKPEGGKAPYKYVFYNEAGYLISEDFDTNFAAGLASGKYFCTVIDKNNCKKTIDIEIK